jgi:hypothetical protein
MQAGSSVPVPKTPVLIKPHAALIAKPSAKMILGPALRTAIRKLSRRHRHERAVDSLNDLQIAHHKITVQRDAAKCLQTIFRPVQQFDSNLGDFHGCCPQ